MFILWAGGTPIFVFNFYYPMYNKISTKKREFREKADYFKPTLNLTRSKIRLRSLM